jgi:hypothetical protein
MVWAQGRAAKPASKQGQLDDLDAEPRDQLAGRLLIWASIALVMGVMALFAVRSDTGTVRLAQLFAPERAPVRTAELSRPVTPDPILTYETRRLADAVRVLGAERDELADRLSRVEQQFGDITASISRGPRSVEAPRPTEAIRTPEPTVIAAAPPTPADSTVMRTDFGVDVAGDVSVDGLRQRWQALRTQHPVLLEGLRPVMAVADGTRPGSLELRLIVGPLTNANAATRLCASLAQSGVSCRAAAFDGQRLALR